MGYYTWFILVYTLGGLTFIPFLLLLALLHAYLILPIQRESSLSSLSLRQSDDDERTLHSGPEAGTLAEKLQSRSHEPDVAAGYFAVCREYVPGGINGKPPERTTPAGAVIAEESPSVYQSMYRSIFDRKQGPSLEGGKPTKKARNVFFVVLRHGHLMLYDDSEQLEVRHVISLGHHDVSIYGGGGDVPEGELWIKRNAIRLSRKPDIQETSPNTKPFFLFSENCSEKEDFYFALLSNQEHKPGGAPIPQDFDVKHIIALVQRLHSSEEHLQTRWINGLIGRVFLALYRTQHIESFMRMKITKKIARVKKPAFLSQIVIQKIDMGEGAPYITNPRLRDLTVDGDCCVEADVSYSGNFRIEIGTTARIELGSRFKAREVNLVLAAVLKKMDGHVLIRIKTPPSNRAWIAFETMPKMEMTIEPIVSSRQITYTFILRAIESRIREVIAETLVLPHWDDSPFADTSKQRYRGGIWAKDKQAQPPPEFKPENFDMAVSEEAEGVLGAENEPLPPSPKSLGSKEKTMSMPALSESLKSPFPLRRAGDSPRSGTESKDSALSSSVDVKQPPDKLKAMRSNSFASAATPVVTMDTGTVDAIRNRSKGEQRDAASAMIAISSRSRPTSPTSSASDFPVAPALPPATKKSRSSASSKDDDSIGESVIPQSENTFPGNGSITSGPASLTDMSNKTMIAFGNNPKHIGDSLRSHIHSTAKPLENRQSVGSIGSATAAAKKWGWGMLNRNVDIKGANDHSETHQRPGTPTHPMGRGRPLPPPGTPLPPPEKSTSKNGSTSNTKRNSLPPPNLPPHLPPRRQEVVARPVPPPPLSAREIKDQSVAAERADEDLLVVAAPPDSEPTSPLEEEHEDYANATESASETNGSTSSTTPPSERGSSRKGLTQSSGALRDLEDGVPTWVSAQEDEARIKSLWMEANNGES
ncbi:MAG: hypothetical protein M1835_005230 [Candelina submexicana]|nr:MAG: hypothetical protein M1835_005230 [Candelina submexicana]